MAIIGISGKIGSGKDTVGDSIHYWMWKAKVESAKSQSIHHVFKDFVDNPTIGEPLSGWQIKKYADKLKDIVCILLGCTREQLEDREFKETELGEEWWYYKGRYGTLIPFSKDSSRSGEDLIKLTPRLLLQLLGTECGRKILHPNIWVNATMADYKGKKQLGEKIGTPRELPLIYPNWIITDVRFPNEAQAIKERNGIMIRVNRPHYDTSMVALSKAHESETALDSYDFDYVIDNNGTIEELSLKIKDILLKERLL